MVVANFRTSMTNSPSGMHTRPKRLAGHRANRIALLVLAVTLAEMAVPGTPDATTPPSPAVEEGKPIYYRFLYRRNPDVGTSIRILRDGNFAFFSRQRIRERGYRGRYFCLGDGARRHLFEDGRRAVRALPSFLRGRPLFGLKLQHLELFARSGGHPKYFQYLSSPEARAPRRQLWALMRHLHVLLSQHRDESTRIPRSGEPNCYE